MLQREKKIVSSLLNIGLSPRISIELLTSQSNSESRMSLDITKGLFDVRDQSKDSNVIIWFNDFEKDERYKHWPPRIVEVS